MILTYYEKEGSYRTQKVKRPYTTKEGEKVYSKGELEIANFLHEQDIPYHYECKRVIEGKNWFPDFYLWKQDVYIEYEGMADDLQSRKRYAAKYMVFKNNGYKVIYIYQSDLGKIGEVILRKLEEYS